MARVPSSGRLLPPLPYASASREYAEAFDAVMRQMGGSASESMLDAQVRKLKRRDSFRIM